MVLLSLAWAGPLAAQTLPSQLTLEEAIDLAKAHNPDFLSVRNDRPSADWGVRAAYGAFLPNVNASIQGGWTQAGLQRVGTVTLENQVTDWYSSRYDLNLTWRLNGQTIFGVSNARANKRATEASIDAAEFDLESAVTQQYLAVLRGQDAVDVAQRQLDHAQQNRDLANTRVAAGAAAGTEGRQAEVDYGRAEVTLIQAQRDLRQARLLLGEQIGAPVGEGVVLTSQFEVFEPDFDADSLLQTALAGNPSLNAFRAQESASRAEAHATSTSQYLPTIGVQAGLSGYTQEALNQDYVLQQLENGAESRMASCEFYNALETGIAGGIPNYTTQDCSSFAVTAQQRQAALAQNSQFPFDFTKNPIYVGLQVSIPVFTGFSRQRQVSEANNRADDARNARRKGELTIRTQVTSTYDNLVSAYQVVQAESRNRALAEEQLQLQQRRYALGAADLLLLLDAQASLSAAEQGYLNAVYDFHYNLIALEAAVGRPLRPR